LKNKVGTTKKSIPANPFRWLLRKTFQVVFFFLLAGEVILDKYRETVRSERVNPNFSNSPWIRGAPQVGFSLVICRISLINSLVICGLPFNDAVGNIR
jgi:hypothetical protein